VAREVRIHLDLAHPGIIAMYAAWRDATYVYIAMEWAPEVGAGSTLPLRTQLHD
jgi:aurora kinase